MSICENKRTLKKRIRNVVSFCIFFTVLCFGGIVTFLSIHVAKLEAEFISDYFCSSIAKSMNQSFFYEQMGIKGLEEFNPTSVKAKEWVNYITEIHKAHAVHKLKPGEKQIPLDGKHGKDDITIKFSLAPDDRLSIPFLDIKSAVYTKIIVGENVINIGSEKSKMDIFSDPLHSERTEKKGSYIISKLLDYYSHTEAIRILTDSKGNEIGRVVTGVHSEFVLFLFISLLSGILLAGLLSLLIANIINRILTIPITNPLIQLDQKIEALANEDFESSINKQVVLKRPLREIESIADSTNKIMNKMKEYNHLLEEQKKVLENQNDELEAQNEELIESKKQIEEAQSMLVQSENMASIGQLTAAITHEINTPLGAINSNVQICDMFINMLSTNDLISSNEELAETINQMKETNNISILACNRVAEIIKSLKTFSRLDQAEFQAVDIHEGIKSVLVLTSNLWKRKITIHEDYRDLGLVKCFPGLLNQVIMNIMVNAIQSIEEKGDIFIKTYRGDSQVFISIRDTGCGIKDADLPKIFDSGFTTKGAGIGMGLGLSICQNIIKKHDGEIAVISEPGKGTEFIISIPSNK